MNSLEHIVNYYEDYKNNRIPNDDLIAIISDLETMESIEMIDDMIIDKYGANIIDRLDFYDQIYNHHIWEVIMKEIEDKQNKNDLIFAAIFVELHKCNLINQIIESFSEQEFEDTLVARAFHKTLIKQKNDSTKMITTLVECAEQENEVYTCIVELIEGNKNII